MRHGLTLIWVGWQFDVPPQPLLLRLQVPIARQDGQPIAGLVRSDWTVDDTVTTLPLGHRQHGLSGGDPQHPDNVLTERDGRLAHGVLYHASSGVLPVRWLEKSCRPRTHIHMPTGFALARSMNWSIGRKTRRWSGLGIAAVRDMMAYARYDDPEPVSG